MTLNEVDELIALRRALNSIESMLDFVKRHKSNLALAYCTDTYPITPMTVCEKVDVITASDIEILLTAKVQRARDAILRYQPLPPT